MSGTVVVRVPDNFAPYITSDTEAIFMTAVLPTAIRAPSLTKTLK